MSSYQQGQDCSRSERVFSPEQGNVSALSEACATRFLARCDQYGLLPADAQQPWAAFREAEPTAAAAGNPDPAAVRANKIARFKAGRAAKARLEALQVVNAACSQSPGRAFLN